MYPNIFLAEIVEAIEHSRRAYNTVFQASV